MSSTLKGQILEAVGRISDEREFASRSDIFAMVPTNRVVVLFVLDELIAKGLVVVVEDPCLPYEVYQLAVTR